MCASSVGVKTSPGGVHHGSRHVGSNMMPSFRHFFTRAWRGESRGAVEQAAVFRWCATSTRAARDRGRVVVASAAVAFMGWVWWIGTPRRARGELRNTRASSAFRSSGAESFTARTSMHLTLAVAPLTRIAAVCCRAPPTCDDGLRSTDEDARSLET